MESLDNNNNQNLDSQNNPAPNLDEIINQITSNGEFKDMMSQLSQELSQKNTNQEISETDNNDSECLSQEENNMNNYDLLTTFFSDGDGNNICEILNDLNRNLGRIADKLESAKV